MPIYSLAMYRSNYPKSLGSLWQYYRREPFLNANDAIAIFLAAYNDSASFKFKKIIRLITGKTDDVSRKDVEIIALLKYLSRNTSISL